MKKVIVCLLIISGLTVKPVEAQSGLSVFDLLQYVQRANIHKERLKQILIEHEIDDEQLINMVETLETAQNQFELALNAAKNLQDLAVYVENGDLRKIYNATDKLLTRVREKTEDEDGSVEALQREVQETLGVVTEVIPYRPTFRGPAEERQKSEYLEYLITQMELALEQHAIDVQKALSDERSTAAEEQAKKLEDLKGDENSVLATTQLGVQQDNLQLIQNEELIKLMLEEREREIAEEAEWAEKVNNALLQRQADREARAAAVEVPAFNIDLNR